MKITRIDTHTVSVPYGHRENSARVRRSQRQQGRGWGVCAVYAGSPAAAAGGGRCAMRDR